MDVKKQTVSLETIYLGDITTSVNEKLEPYGYTLSTEKMAHSQEGEKHDILWKAIPIGLAFLALFLILQKSGILNLGIGGTTTPITSFIIGFIASLSSCLAVVG